MWQVAIRRMSKIKMELQKTGGVAGARKDAPKKRAIPFLSVTHREKNTILR